MTDTANGLSQLFIMQEDPSSVQHEAYRGPATPDNIFTDLYRDHIVFTDGILTLQNTDYKEEYSSKIIQYGLSRHNAARISAYLSLNPEYVSRLENAIQDITYLHIRNKKNYIHTLLLEDTIFGDEEALEDKISRLVNIFTRYSGLNQACAAVQYSQQDDQSQAGLIQRTLAADAKKASTILLQTFTLAFGRDEEYRDKNRISLNLIDNAILSKAQQLGLEEKK